MKKKNFIEINIKNKHKLTKKTLLNFKILGSIFIIILLSASISLGVYFSFNKADSNNHSFIENTEHKFPNNLLPKLKKKPRQKLYQFNNKLFTSKESLLAYARKGTNKQTYDGHVDNYLFDGKIFNSKAEMNNYVKSVFPIKKINTSRNPIDYKINVGGELSRDVVSYANEKPIRVYKGLNGNAYLTREEALKTYINLDEVYNVEGKILENEYAAREYLENIKKLELASDKNNVSTCYIFGSFCNTEIEIKQWLRNNIKIGFEHRGRSFSDYNYSDYVEKFDQLIDGDVVDQHIKVVPNANVNSYWFDHKKGDERAFYIGPKYVETTRKLQEKPKFEQTSSFSPNFFLSAASSSVFTDTINYLTENEEPFDWENENYLSYIKHVTQNSVAANQLFDLIKSKLFFKDKEFKHLAVQGLTYTELPSTELSDFERWLIMLKRVLNNLKIYYTDNINLALEVEKLFVDAIALVLEKLEKPLDNIYDVGDWVTDFKNNLNFDQIYNFFINQNKFYADNHHKMDSINTIRKIQSIGDKIAGGIQNINSAFSTFDNSAKKDRETLNKHSKQIKTLFEDKIKERLQKVYENPSLQLKHSPRSITKAIPFVNKLAAAWEITNQLSMIEIKQLEYKIDENNTIIYVAEVLKVPFFDFSKDANPLMTYTKLIESPLTFMLPEGADEKDVKVYEFNGKYFIDKEKAKQVLKEQIYQYPEQYLESRTLFTNAYKGDDHYVLDSVLASKKVCRLDEDEDNDCMSSLEYANKLSEEKEKYVNQLFKRHIQNKHINIYLDGFGNMFTSKNEALDSLVANTSENNFRKQYQFILPGTNQKYIGSKEDVIKSLENKLFIESKDVINTDLIKTTNYDALKEYLGWENSVYELDFYGNKKYFLTQYDAIDYVYNHINFQLLAYDYVGKTFKFGDYEFFDEYDIEVWVDENIEEHEVSASEYEMLFDKEII